MPTKATNPVPEGFHTITPSLWFNGDCKQAVEFYEKAFNAKLIGPMALGPDGEQVMHALMKIKDSFLMMADAWSEEVECGPEEFTTAGLWIYTENPDDLFEQAVKAGCDVLMPMMDAFWGDRMGKIIDPFGHVWAIAAHQWIMTQKEQEEAKKAFEKAMMEHEKEGHHGDCCSC